MIGTLFMAVAAQAGGAPLFSDDFESGLERWELHDPRCASLVSVDDAHGRALELSPVSAMAHVLMKGSESWSSYRVEGELQFPVDGHSYLGWIYHLTERDGRFDLGSVYVKGNGSYARVNPRRDWNPARNLYEEYRTPLVGERAIEIGRWTPFAVEVHGAACHLYVQDLDTPALTFEHYEGTSGRAGFKPRVVGAPVRLDNIRVTAIGGLSWRGPSLPPGTDHRPASLHTAWQVLGSLERTLPAVEAHPRHESAEWRALEVDPRGAVLTGRHVDFQGPRTVAYFRTTVEVPQGPGSRLEFSTIDDLALWVDGAFAGYAEHDRFAHHDFGRNPRHPPTSWIELGPGAHTVLVRVRGGRYASGGFFARLSAVE